MCLYHNLSDRILTGTENDNWKGGGKKKGGEGGDKISMSYVKLAEAKIMQQTRYELEKETKRKRERQRHKDRQRQK